LPSRWQDFTVEDRYLTTHQVRRLRDGYLSKDASSLVYGNSDHEAVPHHSG
jgi:hypothetical protein